MSYANSRHLAVWSLIFGLLLSHSAHAVRGFFVRSAETQLVEKVYHLNAVITYEFSNEALEALQNGMPLTVVVNIEIMRNRKYLWSETVTELEQRYRLSYQAVTNRYVIRNLNSGAETSYVQRDDALQALGHISRLPLIDAGVLDHDEEYSVRLRTYLDAEELPVPLRLLSYISKSWSIESEWYSWPLQ